MADGRGNDIPVVFIKFHLPTIRLIVRLKFAERAGDVGGHGGFFRDDECFAHLSRASLRRPQGPAQLNFSARKFFGAPNASHSVATRGNWRGRFVRHFGGPTPPLSRPKKNFIRACAGAPAVYIPPPMLDLSALNPQQRQAVETLRGPVLILAGAGTGKTRVITCRVAHLMVRGVPPANILGVTFTNKAAREMQNRVAQLLPRRSSPAGEASRPTLCTFHSLCVRILRQHIEKLGYKRQFVIYDEAEQLAAVKKILSGLSVNGKKADPAAVRAWLSRYKNGGARAAATDETAALAEHLRRRYESALRACNAVDFDDLILFTLRLFREHPEVLEACRARYRYIMVDEYQDTNAAQFELVHALAKEHRNLCVVGDDDQSIYGWRGAEIANLLDLEKHFPEVKIIKLEQNYRSTTTILRAANALIQNNIRRRGKTLWSANGTGAKIRLCTFDNEEAEAREVVAQIEFRRIARRIPWRDCAILFRTNQQSRPLETALRAAGVRYRLVG